MVIFFLAFAQPDTVRAFYRRTATRFIVWCATNCEVMAFRAALSPIRLTALRSFFKDFKLEIEPLKVRFATISVKMLILRL